MNDQAPSKALIEQRVRNRRIEALELAASLSAQLEYERNVPIANVPAEIIEGWFDFEITGEDDLKEPLYSPDEAHALRQFEATLTKIAKLIPPDRYAVSQVAPLKLWAQLMHAAKQAHEVMMRRGKFGEDSEDQLVSKSHHG